MRLDGIKLLDDIASATDVEVDEYVEHLISQGAGWGLKQIDRIALTMARAAIAGLEASKKLDETQRALKGLQLSEGRARKQLENLQAANTELAKTLDQSTAQCAAHERTIDSLQREVERLQERPVYRIQDDPLDNEADY